MLTLTVPDYFMKTVLLVKLIYIIKLVQFYCNFNKVHTDIVKSSKGKLISHWKYVIYRCRRGTTDFVTAIEPAELMLYATYCTS